MVYFKLYPWGYGDAMLASLISNIVRKKGSPLVPLSDFMPGERAELQTDPWEQFKGLTGGVNRGEH